MEVGFAVVLVFCGCVSSSVRFPFGLTSLGKAFCFCLKEWLDDGPVLLRDLRLRLHWLRLTTFAGAP